MRSSGTSTPGSRHPTPIYALKHSELLEHESCHSAIQSGKQRGSVLKHPRESNNNWSQHVSAIGATLSDASNPCFTKTLSHNGDHKIPSPIGNANFNVSQRKETMTIEQNTTRTNYTLTAKDPNENNDDENDDECDVDDSRRDKHEIFCDN